MFCYSVFRGSNQIAVFPYTPQGDDWKRARSLAIELALKAEENGYHYTVEFFGATDAGKIIWE
jgi:hypothetical protein